MLEKPLRSSAARISSAQFAHGGPDAAFGNETERVVVPPCSGLDYSGLNVAEPLQDLTCGRAGNKCGEGARVLLLFGVFNDAERLIDRFVQFFVDGECVAGLSDDECPAVNAGRYRCRRTVSAIDIVA